MAAEQQADEQHGVGAIAAVAAPPAEAEQFLESIDDEPGRSRRRQPRLLDDVGQAAAGREQRPPDLVERLEAEPVLQRRRERVDRRGARPQRRETPPRRGVDQVSAIAARGAGRRGPATTFPSRTSP